MNLRIAVEKDLECICILAQQINTQHYNGAPHVFAEPEGVHRDRGYWRSNFSADDTVFIIAEINDEITGFVLASITENTTVTFLQKKKLCRVRTIVVSDVYQGQGIGKQLLEAVELWAIGECVDEVRLEVMAFNHGAQQFYDTLGFETQSRILSKTLN